MTVTAIQVGLDSDVIGYSSPDDIRPWYPDPEAVAG
jgi:hypothetical protein